MPSDLYKNDWLGCNPGKFHDFIDIQVSVETQDSFGTPIPTWSAFATKILSDVNKLSGTELFEARQTYAEVTHRINTRIYVAGVTPKHRIIFNARVFDILSVENINERNRFLEIMAKEIV